MEYVYREHPSPTGQMRDGQLIPVPEVAQADTVVWFALPPEGDRTFWEGLAAQSSTPGHAVVRAVPLFARGLGYGDVVSVIASDEGPLVATGVVKQSDHFGFRLWLGDGDAALTDVVRQYGEMGCFIEGYSERLVGLSCPSALAQRVADALAAAEQAGHLAYETAR